MASSSPTTSIPIQEPVFLQFLHDVHHAYLLLHRAMALLPPTLIPNIEPTPLPSTDVWNQPDGLRPHYSNQTNAFIDAVHIPSPDIAEEEALMDELLETNLPEPHQHVAAPSPEALPEPSKLSTTAPPPPKRKQKAKAVPKVPAKRRRLHEHSRSRSSSPLSTWTLEEKQKLRTLKTDEKSRFSWRVISTKMAKSEDGPYTSIATGSLQNKIFPPSKEIHASLRLALRSWTTRNSLPSLPKTHLDALWHRSIHSHYNALHNHITHKDIVRFKRLFPDAIFHNKTSELHPCESIVRCSTSSASPPPSPTLWCFANWRKAQATSSRRPSPRSTSNLASHTHGPLGLAVICRTPMSCPNERSSSELDDQSLASLPHLSDLC